MLDGETLALQDDGRPRPFQETASRFGADSRELLLRPFFFDCLHLDGADLIDEPLSVRLEALEKAAGAHRMPGVLRPSTDEAAALLEQALAAGHEGVMVKALDAPYAAGRRGRVAEGETGAHAGHRVRRRVGVRPRTGRCPTSISARGTPMAANRSWWQDVQGDD